MALKVTAILLTVGVTVAYSSYLKGQEEQVYGPQREHVYKRSPTVDSSSSTSKYFSRSDPYNSKTIEIPTQLKYDRNRRAFEERTTQSSGVDESEGTFPNDDLSTTAQSNIEGSTYFNTDGLLDDVTSTARPNKARRNSEETLENYPKDAAKTNSLSGSSQKPESRYLASSRSAYKERADDESSNGLKTSFSESRYSTSYTKSTDGKLSSNSKNSYPETSYSASSGAAYLKRNHEEEPSVLERSKTSLPESRYSTGYVKRTSEASGESPTSFSGSHYSSSYVKRNDKEPSEESKTSFLQSRYSTGSTKRAADESSEKSKSYFSSKDKFSKPETSSSYERRTGSEPAEADTPKSSTDLTDLQELIKLAEEIDKLILEEEAVHAKLRSARDADSQEVDEEEQHENNDPGYDSEAKESGSVSRQKRLVSGVEVGRSTREKRQLFGGLAHGFLNFEKNILNLEDSLLGIQGHDHNREFTGGYGGGGYGGGHGGGGFGGGHSHGGYEGYGRGYGGHDGYDGLDYRGYPSGRF